MTVLQKYSASKMLRRTTQELMDRLAGNFILVFDDGKEIETNDLETVYSSFFWDIIRVHPFTPLTSDMHVSSVLKGGLANSGTHLKLLERISFSVIDAAAAGNIPLDMDRLGKMIYEGANNLYNYACVGMESDVPSTDILDYVEVLNHPAIKPIMDQMEATEDSIAKAYASISAVIMNDPTLANNALCISARSGMVRVNQLLQCLVTRGYVTDIDSLIFPEPAMGSFAAGYKDFYSLFIDSRTASKSLFFSAKLLRDTEYSSRKLQILCMSLETLHPGDCGSTKYMPWLVRPEQVDENGKVVRESDLKAFAGKYFLDEETNSIKELKPDDTKYLGKMLQFRSTLAGCNHPDTHGTCMTCFGAMGRIIPDKTNIGHLLAAALMQVLSQSILSVKHIDSSSSSNKIILNDYYTNWLAVSPDGKGYMLSKNLRGKTVKFVIAPDEVPNLPSINATLELDTLVIDQISEIETMTMVVTDGIETIPQPLVLMSDKRKASFTHQALEFIKTRGWTNDDRGNYVIDFTGWPINQVMMELPQRHFNTADHAEEITKLIQGSGDDKNKRRQEGSVFAYFHELFELVNKRLQVPAVILEHIIYAASNRNADEDDYRLPRGRHTRQMGLTNMTVPERSMGAGIGFERHIKAIFSPSIFDPEKRADHVFDVVALPKETVADRNSRGLA